MTGGSIRKIGFLLLAVSFLGFVFSHRIPGTLTMKFFLGAFGFGTGFTLLVVGKIIGTHQLGEQQARSMYEGIESPSEDLTEGESPSQDGR